MSSGSSHLTPLQTQLHLFVGWSIEEIPLKSHAVLIKRYRMSEMLNMCVEGRKGDTLRDDANRSDSTP
jgi:hypothetical protein